MRPGRFSRFAAIDWSGAKGRKHKGIAVGLCRAGGDPPLLVDPPGGAAAWSRTAIKDWVLEAAAEAPTLFGFDFSYAPPIAERGAYFPGDAGVPAEAKAFWAYVDQVSNDEDLGAASFLESRHRRHFYFGAADGAKRGFLHHRVCEHAFNAIGGGKASTLYDAIGASQVAKASYAGMRLLHRLNPALPVWPMDPLPSGGTSAIVEIYTRVFILMAGLDGRKIRSLERLNEALAALGSAPVRLPREPSDHETDVLVSAAGLRKIAADPLYWAPPALTPALARTEGWTFGVL